MRLSLAALVSVLALSVVACGASEDVGTEPSGAQGQPPPVTAAGDLGDPSANGGDRGDDGEDGAGAIDGDVGITPADDAKPPPKSANEPLMQQQATTTANVNLRKGPGTTFDVIMVIPAGSTVTILDPKTQNDFYNVKFNGATGWTHSAYLTAGAAPAPPATGNINGPPSVANAMERAKLSKGFSYYWGGGAFPGVAATSSNKGSCNGAGCPNCTHSGSYGADCSGLVAKAWQYGNPTISVNSHPYGTVHFINDVAGKWSTVSRGAMKAADALVHHDSGSGHIVIYEKGDGWGSPTVYECKGCQYGCVYNARSFSSAYHAIRRAGF